MKNIIIYCSLLIIGLSSCMNDDAPSAKLHVTLDKEVYNVGEPVTFRFSGKPDNIVFYSGEDGHNYAMKDRLYADNDFLVNFSTFVSWGVIYQNLQFMVSSDFNGIYDAENVSAATWVDVSGQFTFSEGADHVPSGVVNLKPYVEKDESDLYMAFRYTDTEKPQQNRWVVRSINADKVSPEGVKTNMAVMSTMGWRSVDFLNPGAVWQITTAQLLMYGGANQPDNEDWVISKGFKVRESVPDTGVSLKNISTTMEEYEYVYTKPGTYKAIFDTSSVWHSGSKYALTEVTVEVVEPQP